MEISKIKSPQGIEIEVIEAPYFSHVLNRHGEPMSVVKIREEVEFLKCQLRAPGLSAEVVQ